MATETRHSGTLRSDYETDRARLDGFHALTADTDTLLHRLVRECERIPYRDADGREGTLAPLVENHVLTVLADIRRKRLDGYADTFAHAQGTEKAARYAEKLRGDIRRWKARLEAYLHGQWQSGNADSHAAETARRIKSQLEQALSDRNSNEETGVNADKDESHRYHRMLRIVTDIQENADRHLRRVEESGDTEPALALLVAHLKNYAFVADTFNRRLATLPGLYHREVLHAVPREATPDNAYLTVTPAGGGFTLEAGTAFDAGGEQTYRTTRKEYISPMHIASAQTIYKDKSGLHLQPLDCGDTTTAATLFTGGEELRTGWQITSPMLVLTEGHREVSVRFLLKPDGALPAAGTMQGFTVEYATAGGWTDVPAECELSGNELTFSFTIARDGIAPVPCTPELHGMETAYPAIRILTANNPYPVWAEGLAFEHIQITVSVGGIRSFTLRNDLGEADTTQPFAPFGMQAERGAWFAFGNAETALKPLTEVTLTGTWQQLPATRHDLDKIYKDYPDERVDTSAFRIRTEYRQNGKWQGGESQPLFALDSDGRFGQANITLGFPTATPAGEEAHCRVTLDSPGIGFGQAAYRSRFTEVMMHNSRCKEKNRLPIPQEPPIPLLADVELAYRAEAILPAESATPIAEAACGEAPPREGQGRLIPLYSVSAYLCLALANAAGEQRVRLYLDMALPQDKLPYYHPDADAVTSLVWQHWDGTEWTDIPTDGIAIDETAGLTQGGFVEIRFGRAIPQEWLDCEGRLWLRAAVIGDMGACLALRRVWTNCFRVTADDGDGTPLPAGTIQGTVEEDPRIGSVAQPLPGFGGIPAETEAQSAARRTARLANRHRAVTRKDYEQILLEHFPEADYVQCITLPKKAGVREKPEVRLVVFSRAEDGKYFLSSPWKLKEMERTLRQYAPPHVRLRVTNPEYEAVEVRCAATLHFGVQDPDKTAGNLKTIVENYFFPWRRNGGFPNPGQTFSAKELCARMMNHEDLQRVTSLMVNGKEYITDGGEAGDTIRGTQAWSILLPEVEITLSAPDDGIGGNGIGSDFVIG